MEKNSIFPPHFWSSCQPKCMILGLLILMISFETYPLLANSLPPDSLEINIVHIKKGEVIESLSKGSRVVLATFSTNVFTIGTIDSIHPHWMMIRQGQGSALLKIPYETIKHIRVRPVKTDFATATNSKEIQALLPSLKPGVRVQYRTMDQILTTDGVINEITSDSIKFKKRFLEEEKSVKISELKKVKILRPGVHTLKVVGFALLVLVFAPLMILTAYAIEWEDEDFVYLLIGEMLTFVFLSWLIFFKKKRYQIRNQARNNLGKYRLQVRRKP